MAKVRGGWINGVAGLVGGVFIALGVLGLRGGFSVQSTFLAVLGFLIAGWAVLDYRRFMKGVPESELEGGHTVE